MQSNGQTIDSVRISGNLVNLCRGGTYTLLFATTGTFSGSFTAQLSDSSGTFSSYTSIGSWPTNAIPITIPTAIPNSFNYSIRVVSSFPSIIGDTLINITITLPTSIFTFSPTSPCSGANVYFTNSSTGYGTLSYNWNFSATPGAPSISYIRDPIVSFNPAAGVGTISYLTTLTVTDGYGCSKSSNQYLYIKKLPDVRLDTPIGLWDQGIFSICDTAVSFFCDSIYTSTSGNIFSVNWGDGNSTIYSQNGSYTVVNHIYNSYGYFSIDVTASNSNGCSNNKTYNLYKGYLPKGQPQNSGFLQQYCNPSTVAFPIDTVLTNQNPPGTTYQFSVNDSTPSLFFNQSNLPPVIYHTFTRSSCGITSYNNSTPYLNSFLASLNVTNPCGQAGGLILPIRVISKLVANFTINPSNTACVNNSIIFTNASSGSSFNSTGSICNTNLNKLWSISPGISGVNWNITSGTITSQSITVNFLTTGNYQIKLKITQPSNPTTGCNTDSIIKTICVQPVPIPNFNLSLSPASGCVNNIVTATNTSNTLLSCAVPVYTWSVKDSNTSLVLLPGSRFNYTSGTDSNSVNPVFVFTQKGRYKIRLTISNTCPGNFFKDTFIIIKDFPVVSLKPDIIYCDSQTLFFGLSNPNHNPTYDSSYTNISNYNWSITPSVVYVVGNNGSRNPTIRFNNLTLLPITYRVILIVTNECGISAPDTQYITINPQPIVTPTTGSLAFCSGGTTNIALANNLAGSVTYYWKAIPSSPNLAGYSSQFTGVAAGPIIQTLTNSGNSIQTVTYRITAKQLSTNCNGDSVDVVITVFPIPHVLASNQAICSGFTTNLILNSTVATSQYTWTATSIKGFTTGFSNQSTAIAGPISHTLINSSNSTIDTVRYVIRAIANGCNSPDTNIYVLVYPTPVTSGSTQTLCSNDTANFTPSSTLAGTTFNYIASLTSGTLSGFSNGSGPIKQKLTNAGNIPGVVRYTITPTGPGPSSCVGTSVYFDVTVNPIPILTVSSSSTICSGTPTNIVLNANVVGALFRYDTLRTAGTNTYGYYSKTIDTLGPIAQTIFNNGTLNAVVRYTITPRFGTCVGTTQTHAVTIIPGPVPGTLAPAATVCSSTNSGIITLTGYSGTIIRWERSVFPFTGFDSIANTNPTYSYLNLTQSTKYRVVVNTGASGACGEVKSAFLQISVDSQTIAGTLNGTDTVCISGNSGNLLLNGIRGTILGWQNSIGTPGFWSNITPATTANPYSYLNLTQTTWYRVMVKNGVCPQINSDSVKIKVDSIPSPAVTRDTSFCLTTIGVPITGAIAANNISSGIGTWRFLSGPTIPIIANITQVTTSISNLLDGIYFIEWKVSNGKCPPNLDTLKLSIYQPLSASIGSDQIICSGQAPLLLTGPTPIGGNGIYSYQWQQSVDGTNYVNISATNTLSYQAPILTANTWYRRITLSGSCISFSNIVLITVYPRPNTNFTLAPSKCANDTFSLLAINNPIATITATLWTVTNTGGFTNNILNNYSSQNPKVSLPENKTNLDVTYTIKLLCVSDHGCSDSISNSMVLKRRPLAQFSTGSNINCGPAVYSITNGTTNVVSSYLWSTIPAISVNINTSISTNPTITLPVNTSNLSQTYLINLIATRNDGSLPCADTISHNVIVYPKPQAIYGLAPSDTGCSPLSVLFTNSSNARNNEGIGSMSFLWSFTNLPNDTARNQAKTFTNSGVIDSVTNVRLIATTQWGCKDTMQSVVRVYPFPKSDFNSTIYSSCAPFQINGSIINLQQYLGANDLYTWQILNKSLSIISTSYGISIPVNTIVMPNDTIYLRLITSNSHNCKPDTLTRLFRTISNPVASFNMSDSVGCSPLLINFSNTSTIGVTSAWTFSNGAIAGGTNPFPITFINGSNTTNAGYSAKLVITAGTGCKDSITKLITIYPKPLSSFNITSPVCANSVLTPTNNSIFKIGSIGYGWKFVSPPSTTLGQISDSTSSAPNFTFPDNQLSTDTTYNIRLRVTSVDGCIHDTSRQIAVLRRPSAIFSVTQPNCGPSTITANNTTSNVGSTWLWSINPTAGTSIVTNTTQNPQISFPINNTNDSINYRISLTAIRTGTTCLDTTSRIITIYPKPQALFTTVNLDSCGPRLVYFTNTSNAKNGEAQNSMNFLWSFLNNNLTTINASGNFINSQANDSNYNIRLIATTKHSCIDTSNAVVVVRPNAKAIFISNITTSCAPFTITSLNVIANPYPNANLDYFWYANNNLIGSAITFPGYILPNANDSVLIKLKTISKNGCKNDSMMVWFRTIPNPIPAFNMSDSIGCSPLLINFTNTSTVGVSSAWTFSNGAFAGGTNPFPLTFINNSNSINAGFTAKLVITAGTGCKDSITKLITIYPKPYSSFNVTSPVCANSVLTPTNNSIFKIGSVSFGWKFVAPPSNTLGQISDSTSSAPNFTFTDNQLSTDTTYNIRLRVTSVDGCIHDTSRQIAVLRRPSAIFSVTQPNCGPSTITANNTTSNVGSTWLWSINPTAGTSIVTNTTQNPQISFPINNTNDSINYRISLTATRTGTTCLDTTSRIVTIYPKPQTLFSTVNLDSCGPRVVYFTNGSNAKNGEGQNTMSFLWSFLNNNFTTTNSFGTFINSQINDSNYNVRLIATTKHGCIDTTNQNINVRANAKAVYTRTLGTSCAPFFIAPTNVVAQSFPNANISYQWYINNLLVGSGINFPGYTMLNQADSVIIKLKAISKNGCKNDSMEMWFYTIENPKPNFVAIDSIVCSGVSINFQNTSTPANGLNYLWQFGNPQTTSTLKNPPHIFLNFGIQDTTIIIKLITLAGGTGCSDSISKSIIIKPLPNPDFSLSDTILCAPNILTVTNISTQIPPINPTSYHWYISPYPAIISNDTSNSQTSISIPSNPHGLNFFYQVKLVSLSIFGCKDSMQKMIRNPTQPVVIYNFVNSACGPITVNTNNNSLWAISYQWSSLNSGVTVGNPNAFNTSFTFPVHKGIIDSIYYTKLVATSVDGCIDYLVKPFVIFPKPISSFIKSLDSGCAPLNVIFFNQSIIKKPASYNWNYGDGTGIITSLDTLNKTYFGSIYQDTTYYIRLITTSTDGCKDTLSKSIFIQSGAVARIHLDDTIICSNTNNPTKLKISNYSFGSVDSFYWDFGDGTFLNTTKDTAIYHPYPFEGTYTIILKASNSCRTSFDSVKVTVQVPPNVNFTKTDSVGCSPLLVTFNNTSTKIFQATYYWNFGNGNTSTDLNPPVQTYLQALTTDTFYHIKLNVSNICGVFPKYDTVRVLPRPTAIFSTNTDTGCSPIDIYILNLSVGSPQNIKWYFGNGDSSNRFTPLQNPIRYTTIDTPSVYKIRLILSNICGVDSTQKYITVLPNTVKSFFNTSAKNGCQTLTVNFTDMSGGGQNVSWNFGDGSSSTLRNPIHTYVQPGIYKAMQFVNNNCSFDTSSLIITVWPRPRFTIDRVLGNICVNQPIQFRANLIDSGSIKWFFGDGDSSSFYNPIHSYLSSGQKIIHVTVTSNFNNCFTTLSDSVTVQPIPVVSINADTNRACLYHTFILNANSNGNNYLAWDFGDGNYAIVQDTQYRFSKSGTYIVKVVATSINGCTDSAVKQIDVWPLPIANFDYTPKDTCNGPAWVQFNNLSMGANAYHWDFGNGNTSTNTNGFQFYTGLGKYAIQLICTNTFLCTDDTTRYFEIFTKPQPSFTFDVSSGCVPLTVKFTNTSKLSKTYIWYFGDGDTSMIENPEHTFRKPGIYNVSLVAFAGMVCSDSFLSSNTISVHPKPLPSFTAILNTSIFPNREVIFTSTSQNGKIFEWNFGNGFSGLGEFYTYKYQDEDSGCFNVTLHVISKNNCDTSVTDTVCMPGYWKGLFVPNAFTPGIDNPAVNHFTPSGRELKTYHLMIYDKWGSLIWETNSLPAHDKPSGWPGVDKDGNPCKQDTYIWKIEATFSDDLEWPGQLPFEKNNFNIWEPESSLKNSQKKKYGNVTLIR